MAADKFENVWYYIIAVVSLFCTVKDFNPSLGLLKGLMSFGSDAGSKFEAKQTRFMWFKVGFEAFSRVSHGE